MSSTGERGTQQIVDLEALLLRCLGNAALADRVLQRFANRLGPDLTELEEAAAAQDAEQVALVAHRIKGASANLSAARLTDAAAEIEQQARQGRLGSVPRAIQDLREMWREFQEVTASLDESGERARSGNTIPDGAGV